MVCEADETDLNIHIPAVMLPQDAGASLERMLMNSSNGKHFLVLHNHKATANLFPKSDILLIISFLLLQNIWYFLR